MDLRRTGGVRVKQKTVLNEEVLPTPPTIFENKKEQNLGEKTVSGRVKQKNDKQLEGKTGEVKKISSQETNLEIIAILTPPVETENKETATAKAETLNICLNEKTDSNRNANKKIPAQEKEFDIYGTPTPPFKLETKETTVPVKRPSALSPEVEGEFGAPDNKFDIYDLATAPDDTIWVCCRKSMFVTHFDIHGTVLEEIEFDDKVNCLSVSSTTGHLWVGSGKKHRIYEIDSSGKKCLRFHVNTLQKCICVLKNESIAVGMLNEVGIYTSEGKEIVSKNLKRILNRISECPVTENIGVLVLDYGIASESSIVILNKELIILRWFNLSYGVNDTILASCISYDGKGDLVVAAVWYNGGRHNVVILLDGHGQHLRTISKGKSNVKSNCKVPLAFATKNGFLWTVFHDTYKSPQKLQLLNYISRGCKEERYLQSIEFSTYL